MSYENRWAYVTRQATCNHNVGAQATPKIKKSTYFSTLIDLSTVFKVLSTRNMNAKRKGALLALGSSFGAALFYIPFKQASTMVARDVVVMSIVLVAAILNTLVTLAQGARALRFDWVSLRTAFILGLFTISGNIGAAQALVHVSAGITSIVQQTQILFVALGSLFFLGERLSARFFIGSCIVLGGILLINVPSTQVSTSMNSTGILWALLSSMSFAAMHVTTRMAIDRIQPVTVNALRLWMSVAILVSVPGNASTVLDLDHEIWLLCAAAAFAGPFLARIALMFAVKYISASHCVLITLFTPVLAFTFDFMFLGSQPTLWHLIGGVIVIFGVSIPLLELIGHSTQPVDRSG